MVYMMSLSILTDIVSWILILSGSSLVIIGSIGFFRFREFWSRLHAASVIDSGGMLLIVFGMCVQSGFTLVTVKLILIAVFLIITGPTATHAIANAAMISGLKIEGKNKKQNRTL